MKIINFRFPRQPKSKHFIKNSLPNHHTQSHEFCINILSAINTNKQDPLDIIANILNQNNIQHLVTILQYYNRHKTTINKDRVKKMEEDCENVKTGHNSKSRSKIEEKNLEIRSLHQKIGQLKAQLERKNQKINSLVREYQNWHIQKQRHELLSNIGNYDKYWKSFNSNLISCQPVKMGSSQLCRNKRLMRKQYRTKKINKNRSHQLIQQAQKMKANENTKTMINNIGKINDLRNIKKIDGIDDIVKIKNMDNIDDIENMDNIDKSRKISRNDVIGTRQVDKILKQHNLNVVLFETDNLIASEELICDQEFDKANSGNEIDRIKTCSENNSQKQINDRNSECHNMDVSDCSDFPQEMFI